MLTGTVCSPPYRTTKPLRGTEMNSVRLPDPFEAHDPSVCSACLLTSALRAPKSQLLPILQARRPFRRSNRVRTPCSLPTCGAPLAGMPDLAALPAAPSPHGSGGGQYDNRGGGGGGTGGIRSHLTYEVGGGFNAPTQRLFALHHVGRQRHGGRRLSLQPESQPDAGVPVHRRQTPRRDHRRGWGNRTATIISGRFRWTRFTSSIRKALSASMRPADTGFTGR